MNIIKQNNLKKIKLPGRCIMKAIGLEGFSKSNKMTMGFATYSSEYGPMEPHHHAEEIVFILRVKKGYIRYGQDKLNLSKQIPLEKGMILHFGELEWHVFEYDKDGFIEIIFFYGQVDNIRPEEILKKIAN